MCFAPVSGSSFHSTIKTEIQKNFILSLAENGGIEGVIDPRHPVPKKSFGGSLILIRDYL